MVAAAGLGLDTAVSAELREGRWLDAATGDYPAVVLGSTAARRLAVGSLDEGVRVWLDGQWFAVIGVLEPVVLAPELDATALIGVPVAEQLYGDGENLPPTTVYTRVDTDQVTATRALLGRTANPSAPTEVSVSRPSDALEAQAAADASLTTLTLGLGAVALLVGAVGIANVMVISVLERRREIGVRRALGATRAGIGSQFLTESVLLSLLGGLVGGLLGVAVTTAFAVHQDWGVVLPWQPVLAGLGCSLLVGTVVGTVPGPARRVGATDGGAAGDLSSVAVDHEGRGPADAARLDPDARVAVLELHPQVVRAGVVDLDRPTAVGSGAAEGDRTAPALGDHDTGSALPRATHRIRRLLGLPGRRGRRCCRSRPRRGRRGVASAGPMLAGHPSTSRSTSRSSWAARPRPPHRHRRSRSTPGSRPR